MRKEIQSLIAIVASHGAMHGYLVILPAVLPLMKEELGNYFILGLLSSILYMVYGWGSFPVGLLADRFSKKKMIILSMALCGISSILISLSNGLLTAAFAFTLLGVGTCLYHPVGYSLISLLSEEKRGRYMGIQGLGGNIGMAMAFFISAIAGSLLGWRDTFLIWGIVGIALSVINLLFVIESSGGRISADDNTGFSKQGIKENLARLKGELNFLRTFFLIIFIVVISGMLWSGVSSFLVAYINETKNATLVFAGGLATISYTVGSFAQVIGGELSDKVGRRLIFLLGFGLFSLTLFLFTLPFNGGAILIIIMVSSLGFLFFVTQSPLAAIVGDIFSQKRRGLGYGINFTVKYGVGGIAPGLAGYLTTKSIHLAFYFFALISIVAFLLSFYLKENFIKKLT